MTDPNSIIKKYADCNGGDLIFDDPYNRMGEIHFLAFMQEMSQNFSLSYDSEEVYGRNDPIMSYRNTKRSMSLSWNVPSTDLYDAKLNRLKTRMLIRMLYPRYENIKSMTLPLSTINTLWNDASYVVGTPKNSFEKYFYLKRALEKNSNPRLSWPTDRKTGEELGSIFNTETLANTTMHIGYHHTQTMVENPLIGIKYANLISAADGGALLGYLDGLSVKPLLDEGYFTECAGEITNPITGKKESVEAGTYPKVYFISCNFNIIHKDPLGYQGSSTPMSNIFQF